MNDEGKGFLGADIPTSSRVDRTATMPTFDQGPAVESMTPEAAAKEWREMTLESDEKYKTFPRSVFLSRRDALHERGFAQQLANEKETREAESGKWLEGENERIAERDRLQKVNEGKRRCDFYFGSEKAAEEAIQVAKKVLKHIGNDSDLEFLESSGLGNDPRVIEVLSNLEEHPKLYEHVRRIGLKNLLQIGSVALKRRKR